MRGGRTKDRDAGGRTPLSFTSSYASPQQLPAVSSAIKSALRIRATDSSRKVSFREHEEDQSFSRGGSSVRDRSRSSSIANSVRDSVLDNSVDEDGGEDAGDADESEEQEQEEGKQMEEEGMCSKVCFYF